MGLFSRNQVKQPVFHEKGSPSQTPAETPAAHTPENRSVHNEPATALEPENAGDATKELPVTWLAILLGGVASIGGFMFGYESGQISGECPGSQYGAAFLVGNQDFPLPAY